MRLNSLCLTCVPSDPARELTDYSPGSFARFGELETEKIFLRLPISESVWCLPFCCSSCSLIGQEILMLSNADEYLFPQFC